MPYTPHSYNPTLLEAVNDVLHTSGLGANTLTTAFGSNDVLTQQVISIINLAGYDLLKGYVWDNLVEQYTIDLQDGTEVIFPPEAAVEAGEISYDLPLDFSYIVNNTMYFGKNYRVDAPKSIPDWATWERYKKGLLRFEYDRYPYRISYNKVYFLTERIPDTDPTFKYVSRNWVFNSSEGDIFKDRITADTDILLFDRNMLTYYAVYKLKTNRGQADPLDLANAEASIQREQASQVSYPAITFDNI